MDDVEQLSLFLAVESGKIEDVIKIVDLGADFTQTYQGFPLFHEWYFETPLNIALRQQYWDIVQIFMQRQPDLYLTLFCELRNYYLRDNEELVEKNIRFLLKGATAPDINRINNINGSTLLHAAVFINIDIVRLFLDAGACINVFNFKDCTALMDLHESFFPSKDITQLLLAAGDIHSCVERVDEHIRGWFLLDAGEENTLQNKCRVIIRHQILQINKNVNLFFNVPKLPLPLLLKNYLLYDQEWRSEKEHAATSLS